MQIRTKADYTLMLRASNCHLQKQILFLAAMSH